MVELSTLFVDWLPSAGFYGGVASLRSSYAFVVGVFGSIAPATDRALAAMGIADNDMDAVLVKVVTSLAYRNTQIVRMRFANAGANRPT